MKVLLAMLLAVALTSISGAQQTSTGAKPSAHSGSGDHAFAMKAGQANLAEVELGKLALEKAARDTVKTFARRMVDDHGKALDELKAIAGKKHVTLPAALDAEHQALSDRLGRMSGAEFDRAYMEAMVDGHKKVAAELRKESQSGSDPELKAWAAKALPTVEAHLTQAETINRTMHSGGATR